MNVHGSFEFVFLPLGLLYLLTSYGWLIFLSYSRQKTTSDSFKFRALDLVEKRRKFNLQSSFKAWWTKHWPPIHGEPQRLLFWKGTMERTPIHILTLYILYIPCVSIFFHPYSLDLGTPLNNCYFFSLFATVLHKHSTAITLHCFTYIILPYLTLH